MAQMLAGGLLAPQEPCQTSFNLPGFLGPQKPKLRGT